MGETTVCNQVLINDSQGYSSDTGVFIGPKTSVYFFTYTIHNYNKEANVKLVKDEELIIGAVVVTPGVSENSMASNSAIICARDSSDSAGIVYRHTC